MKERASNLLQRLATAAVAVPVILGLLYVAPPWGFYLLVLAASLVAVYELLAMTHPADRVSQVIGIAMSAAASAAVYLRPDDPRVLMAVLVTVANARPPATPTLPGGHQTAAPRACALALSPVFPAGTAP